MKSTRKMKILSILMSAAMVFGTMPASIAMGAENDDNVQNEETVPESGYVEDEGTGSVENAVEEVSAEEVTDENEYGIQFLDTDSVNYVDADGTEKGPVTATELTSNDTTWNAGWYVAKGDVKIETRITVSGAVNLILADNCTLTASTGITVASGDSLTIYGQSGESGTLKAYVDVNTYRNAAIGGREDQTVGTIIINGGIVNADSRYDNNGDTETGAAIGDGKAVTGTDGEITINGGTVTASAGSGGAAAIGGGEVGPGEKINISGGTVTASAGNGGDGIGGGSSGSTFTTGDNGHAFIVASSISDRSQENSWSGAIIIGNSGQVYGQTTLTTDAEIPSGDSLLIPNGTSLTVASGTTLTNSGTVYQNWGSTFNKNDFYVGNGATYYQIVNNIGIDDASLQDTTTYPGSSWTYGQEGNKITISLSDEKVLKQFTLTKNDGSSDTIDDSSFSMPDEPVTISDGVAIIMVPIPETNTEKFTYNGTEQTYTLQESDYYTIDGNVQTDAGTYTVTVSLTDPTTSMWDDGTTEDKPYTFVINKADQELSYADEEVNKITSDKDFVNELTRDSLSAEDGPDVTYTSSDVNVATVDQDGTIHIKAEGTVTITASAAETDNFNAASASYTLTVTSASLTATVTVNDGDDDYNNGEYKQEYNENNVTLKVNPTWEPDSTEIAYTYQWSKDGEKITGATNATYTLDGNVSDSGIYSCEITGTVKDHDPVSISTTTTVSISKAAQDISYGVTTVSKYDYDEPFTNELTKTKVVGAITYSFTTQSGDEPVIALDENSGEVTIHGPGVVTVTATASGTDNYNEATASYVLVVNADTISVEIDVNHDRVPYDEGKGGYFYDSTYSGADLELEMTLDFTNDEKSHLEGHEIAYQWSSYDFGTDAFHKIDGANGSAYTLSGDAVNAGDYIYMCEAVVTYDDGYTHTVYSVIEITIDKAKQNISYAEDTLSKTTADEDFTNDLTKTVFSTDEDARITYTSSDADVATVDENGQVHILSAGETTIQATAVGTTNYYEDTASYTLTVTDAALSATVTVNGDEKDYNKDTYTKTYDGKDVTLTVTPSSASESEPIDYTYQWSKDDEVMEGATDAFYTLSGGDVSDSGKYSCLVTAAYPNGNKAKVTVEVTVDITQAEIIKSMFTVDTTDETYTGSPITKEITSDLVEGTDYTVSYADNTNEGTATITITGTGNYTGELTYTFTIRPADFGEGDITASGYSGVYDGKAHSITVALSGAAEDATVTYSTEEDGPYTEENPEFTAAGTHTVYYKVSKDNYNEVTGSETVDIVKLNIKAETTVTVTAADLVYNGSRQNAGIVVTAKDGTVLEKGVDYILNGQTAKAAGTHKATLTGIGKFYGTTTVNYKIAKADQKLTAKVKKTGTKKYTIKASKLKNDSRTFKIKVTKKGKMKVRYSTNNSKIKVNKNGKVTLKKGLKAGTYKIKVTTGASKNYKASKNPKYITVKVK